MWGWGVVGSDEEVGWVVWGWGVVGCDEVGCVVWGWGVVMGCCGV